MRHLTSGNRTNTFTDDCLIINYQVFLGKVTLLCPILFNLLLDEVIKGIKIIKMLKCESVN